ncbi:MAG: hypothetical protein WBO70_06870 [Erysipelotrichaceae bacterium]
MNKDTKKTNEKFVKLQDNFNKGWKIGPWSYVVLILLLILFIYLVIQAIRVFI